ncbi:restriction system protein [Vibrio crassostreae]|uniref:Restriction endonuclease type IV Mrr domain-containing protein n=2 Tax=Vibrio crassostreae TaxID=246167 RepID=A0A822MTD7_9VIBR|nr:restriction endonuclease [Vibrio crassostreae]TCN07393.1 restriction endonuclease [Vibrio crassostreae]TCU08460.1 restriction endonuclease [Vibrio crassostreae]CAK1883947.1 restriction system protein [Vibrio crassostreae]CAK1901041.1 restriction system protein [Vibrio crassostreae]
MFKMEWIRFGGGVVHFGGLVEKVETSEDYEKLARRMYEDILALEGVDNIDVQHNVKVKGKSGVEHQIDVYWEYRYAGISHKVLIECKYYSHNVSLLHVRNLHGLLTDIPNSSGILITTKGFQSGADQYAQFYDIGLKRIRAPENSDWDGCIQIVNVDMEFIQNQYLGLRTEFDGHCQQTKSIIEANPDLLRTFIAQAEIEDAEGSVYDFIAFLDKHVPSRLDAPDIEHELTVYTKGCKLLTPAGEKLSLGRLIVKYATTIHNQALHIDAKNAVEAILEDFSSGEVEHMHRKNV